MNLMTQEQLDRYEAFRRSAINKLSMRRVRHPSLPSALTLIIIFWQACLFNKYSRAGSADCQRTDKHQ